MTFATRSDRCSSRAGASLTYVKEQMGHSSIQVTVDIYGHLIPGSDVAFVDRLDAIPANNPKTSTQQSATQAQPDFDGQEEIPPELVDLIGGGGRTRTYDLRIMSHPSDADSKANQQLSSEESGEVRQNPQPRRNPKAG